MSTSATTYNMSAQPSSSSTIGLPPTGRMRESSRKAQSSRRTRGSTGPAVTLGGGAGILGSSQPVASGSGSASGSGTSEHAYSNSPFLTSAPLSTTTAGSPHFPVHFASPTTPNFPSPISPQFPTMFRAPSPLPPVQAQLPQLPPLPQHPQPLSSRAVQSSRMQAPGSTSSLSTTASTSSRTLKTPHSKLDQHAEPKIAGSSDSHGSGSTYPGHNDSPSHASSTMGMGMPLKERPEPRSPTPTQRTVMSKTYTAQSSGRPSPQQQMIQSTLAAAPTPADYPAPAPAMAPRKMSSMIDGRPTATGPKSKTRAPPAPLEIKKKKDNRLSQDWVQIDLSLAPQDEFRAKSTSPLIPETIRLPSSRETTRENGLPAATMVPMKGGDNSLSPRRPSYERSQTAPPLSPTEGRAQRGGRQSLDQLRSTSPTPARGRQNSLSTPPAAVLESGSGAKSGKTSLFRNTTNNSPPQLRTRRSEDILRPSMDSLRGTRVSERDTRSAARDQHRALGVGNGTPPLEAERKSSGLSLKKSSGALKALFNRGSSNSKGKDKSGSSTPPVPPIGDQRSISSGSKGRPSTAPRLDSPQQFGSGSRSTSSPVPSPADIAPGRRSLGVERSLYPTPPNLHRAASHSSQARPNLTVTTASGPSQASQARQRLPSRDLPPPPVSPVPQQQQQSQLPQIQQSQSSQRVQQGAPAQQRRPAHPRSGTGTPKSGSTESMAQESNESPSKEKFSTLAEALPTSSLPYLSPLRASFLLESTEAAATLNALAATPSSSVSPASFATAQEFSPAAASSSTTSTTSTTPTPPAESSLTTSRSLHLLSLPELDLNFDMSFDKIGISPSTPRGASPKVTRRSPIASPTPQRSLTTKFSPKVSPRITRNNSERRRSQSFDGGQRLTDLWTEMGLATSPSISKLFAVANSNSAPTPASRPLEPTTSDDSRPDQQQQQLYPIEDFQSAVYPSQPSAPSSLDHTGTGTPSNASSTNETPSPSPPQTPEEERSDAFGYTKAELPSSMALHHQHQHAGSETKPFGMGGPPDIPLPALPTTPPKSKAIAIPAVPFAAPAQPAPAPASVAQLAPPAMIEEVKPVNVVKPIESKAAVVKGPRKNIRVLGSKSVLVNPDPTLTTLTLSREMERNLYAFRAPSALSTSSDRANIIRSDLLPLLAEIDNRSFINDGSARALRVTCFEWADALLFELQVEQPANERGASLEGLAGIVESACLSENALAGDKIHQARFTDVMVKCMSFVMSKLGAKGVFHNTLLFSGRFLAFAFFRVPHIGEQLVTVLQPPRGALMRFTKGSFDGTTSALPAHAKPHYPAHLLPLCFDDSRSYTARLASLSAEFSTEKERDAFLFQPGNWLRRWQSDDSELFPAFYRAYHRQLAIYLAPVVRHYESLSQPLPAAVLLRAPGYAHLATIFAKKCHSYILGSVNAVTTSSSAQNFEATETAGFRGSQKPAVLETANRRLVETMSTFANTRVMIPDHVNGQVMECDGALLWSGMLDLWTKNLVSKTSLYAPKGVFSLFDLLDGIVDPPLDPITGERRLTETSLLDVPYLIHVIRLVLTEGEHALTLVKVIAFVFTHWEVLTARVDDRRELCLDLLLEKGLFERLLLFWSQSVRSYVLRLVVFRLGHLHTQKEDGAAHDVEIESVRLLQTRLDRIKKRHDELEPKSAAEIEQQEKDEVYLTPLDGGSLPRSRSTITMVADSPRTGSANKAERLLGLGFGNVERPGEVEEGGTKMGKATNWLKKSFGNKKKGKKENGESPSPSPSPNLSVGGGSPAAFDSPINQFTSPLMPYSNGNGSGTGSNKVTPDLRKLGSPMVATSPVSSTGSSSPTSESTRKPRPPKITTTTPSGVANSSPLTPQGPMRSPSSTSAGGNSFAFEFELPTMSPRSDTFDPTPTPTPASPARRNSQPPSPRQPQSPHMSRSFSKRSSLLPPPTATILAETPNKKSRSDQEKEREREKEKEKLDLGYHPKLHAYAIRMLAELEDAQKEYDEWWSEDGIGRMDGAPPRLTVAWPFHEGEE